MELICPECKSSKIYMSAYLVWSCDKQSWVIDEAEGMADGETYCANCFNQSFEPEEEERGEMKIYECVECGSDKLRETVTRWVNDGAIPESWTNAEQIWCEDCDAETKMQIRKRVK